jgi:hypothetical protein
MYDMHTTCFSIWIYIQPNYSTAEAAAIIDVAAAADVSVATDTAYSASDVSILDDAEGDITVKAVLGEKKSDVVEASAPADAVEASDPVVASAVVAVTFAMSAATVASAAAAALQDVVSVGKKGVSGLPLFFAWVHTCYEFIFVMNAYVQHAH